MRAQVREEEIADDYPLPKQYEKDATDEETDELLLADEELLGEGGPRGWKGRAGHSSIHERWGSCRRQACTAGPCGLHSFL